MVAKAHARYLRISPRKVKIVADLIRGKSLPQATGILLTTPTAAARASPPSVVPALLPLGVSRPWVTRRARRTTALTSSLSSAATRSKEAVKDEQKHQERPVLRPRAS